MSKFWKSAQNEYMGISTTTSTLVDEPDKLHLHEGNVRDLKKRHVMMKQSSMVFLSYVFPLLVFAVILGWIVVPYLIHYQIISKVVISPELNPELYKAWIHPPVPIYCKVYLFNVTNSDQIKHGELPKLQEVGPFVFRENRTKINITEQKDADTVTYIEYISYHYEKQHSGEARLDDEVTIINVPFVAAAIKISQDLPWPMDQLAMMILINYKEDLFVQKKIEDALFQGWKVAFLEKIESDLGFTLIPNNTFGFFVGQNNTSQGPFSIFRGSNDKSSFGTIVKFKNKTELDFWPENSSCNKLIGTDGTIFPPFVNTNTVLKLFNADLCRSLNLTYEKDTVFEGIKGYRFTAPASVLQDPRESDANRCFCADIEENPEKCLKQGALDLRPCREGAPVALSTPYFLDANPEYIANSGLIADRGKHETFIVIEPLTGLVLDACKRIQINLQLKRVKSISSLSKVPEMLFPLVWMEESASLDKENAEKVKNVLFQIWIVDFVSKWGLTGIIGVIWLIFLMTNLRLGLPFTSASNYSYPVYTDGCWE